MDFDEFADRLSKIKNLPLPGAPSHYKMAPEVRVKELQTYFKQKKDARKAAVMALFYPDTQHLTRFLLILRKKYPGVHSGQVGFPGGRLEPEDRNLLQTALRETEEEVGTPGRNIEVIRPVSELYIPPSNFQVQPYLGILTQTPEFTKQASEVEALLEVPLSEFMDDSNIIATRMTTSYARDIEVPAYFLRGYHVWGATAMMLSEIRELFRKIL
ncbi:MAG: CoA pyrophosphatase [Eudoraea sp.]|nr:CoA pyrophosphatase [Eudoraea sp.]MBT8223660.1 CoA pyrophosphatase [Eudoraea sp.]